MHSGCLGTLTLKKNKITTLKKKKNPDIHEKTGA